MDKPSERFKKRLTAALSERGAIAHFCRKTGFSRTGVQKWLDGRATPTIASLETIADFFGCKVSELVDEKSPLDGPLAPIHDGRLKTTIERALELLEAHAKTGADPNLLDLGALSADKQRILRELIGLDDSQMTTLAPAISSLVDQARRRRRSKNAL